MENNINTILNAVEVRRTMDFFEHRYYRVNKMLLELLGIWPYQSLRVRVLRIIVILFFAVGVIVAQVITIMKHLGDWNIIMEIATQLSGESIFFVRQSTAVFNSHKILQLLNHMRLDWEVWSQDRDIEILHKYAEKGRKMTTIFTVVLMTTCTLIITLPVIPKIIDVLLKNGTELGQFPMPVDYYFIDMQKYYIYVVMHMSVWLCCSFIMGSAHDTLIMVYVQHGCGLFAILRHKLERLERDYVSAKSGKIVHRLDKQDMTVKYLAWCIDKHNDAIEYAELLSGTYSWFFFFMGIFHIIFISTQGMQVLKNSNDPEIFMKFGAAIVMTIGHVYIETYIGQILIDHSISISSYILRGKWYMLPLKVQKLLPMIMMRCKVPCKLTASNLTFLSMETFVMISKTSLSYFTLLRSV